MGLFCRRCHKCCRFSFSCCRRRKNGADPVVIKNSNYDISFLKNNAVLLVDNKKIVSNTLVAYKLVSKFKPNII